VSIDGMLLAELAQDSGLRGRLNQGASVEAIDEAVKQVLRHDSPSLVLNNAAFHRMLVNGLEIETMGPGGTLRGERVRLFELDPTKADENDWLVVQQLDVVDVSAGKGQPRRPDVVVFVNGLPLAILELKNPADEHADVFAAYNQLQTYKQDLPSLFVYNQVLVGSDDVEARIGSLTAPRSRFLAWRTIEGDALAPLTAQPLEVLIRGVFDKGRFLELVRSFVTFESVQGKTVKKIAGYHQFHAVRKAVARRPRRRM
jgi:type I restriction enzyme R subunit